MARLYRYEQTQIIPRARQDVWDFFTDAKNLERLTPAFLHFRITTEGPVEVRPGTRIEYRLSLHGIPFAWETRIEAVDAPHSFTDVQVRGPYQVWRHVHTFEDAPHGTEMRDVVDYALPLGLLGRVARSLFVRRQLEAIFAYRRQAIERFFPPLG
jgi:ligand-binding SRPBCC domain-containing protein